MLDLAFPPRADRPLPAYLFSHSNLSLTPVIDPALLWLQIRSTFQVKKPHASFGHDARLPTLAYGGGTSGSGSAFARGSSLADSGDFTRFGSGLTIQRARLQIPLSLYAFQEPSQQHLVSHFGFLGTSTNLRSFQGLHDSEGPESSTSAKSRYQGHLQQYNHNVTARFPPLQQDRFGARLVQASNRLDQRSTNPLQDQQRSNLADLRNMQGYRHYSQQPYGNPNRQGPMSPSYDQHPGGYGQPSMPPPYGYGPPNNGGGFGYPPNQQYNHQGNYGAYTQPSQPMPYNNMNPHFQQPSYDAGMGGGMGYPSNMGNQMGTGPMNPNMRFGTPNPMGMGNVNHNQMGMGHGNPNQMGMGNGMNQQPYNDGQGGGNGSGYSAGYGGYDSGYDKSSNNPSYHQKQHRGGSSYHLNQGQGQGQGRGQSQGKFQPSNFTVAPVLLETGYNGRVQHFIDKFDKNQGNKGKGGKSVKLMEPDSEEDNFAEDEGRESPTPKSKLDARKFNSEPRKKEKKTPILRSIQSKSISTDSKKDGIVARWLTKTPTSEEPSPRLSGSELAQRASPSKMLSLLTGVVGDSNSDPFVSGPLQTPQKNPFTPMSSMTTPLATPFSAGFAGIPLGMSRQLAAFTNNGKKTPTIAEVLDIHNIPFIENARTARHLDYGVIKITNIPYSVTRAEVLAFLGRNARLVSEHDHEPIHIVMERVTSKTLDCFVEFDNMDEAINAVNRYENNRADGRGGRLGSRHVGIELSDQATLMSQLFPKAKNVDWTGGKPTIIPTNPYDQFNSGFAGFISSEELVMLQKHVESPQRSPFSKECPQRPFECLISTLYKLPWYMVDFIRIEDREELVDVMKAMIIKLRHLISDDRDINLNAMLLRRLIKAAVNCPGLTPCQKDSVGIVAGYDDATMREFGVPPRADNWGVLWTLAPKADFSDDMVMWYLDKLREGALKERPMSLAEEAVLDQDPEEEYQRKAYGVFYHFKKLVIGPALFNELLPGRADLPHSRTRIYKATLAQVAELEWRVIESTLRSALS